MMSRYLSTHRLPICMARIITCWAVILFIQLPTLSAQTLYQKKKAEIDEQQAQTRSVIQSIDQRISTSLSALDQTTRQYDEMFKTYQQLTILLSLQNQKITEIEKEIFQNNREILLIEQNLRQLRNELERLLNEYRSTLRALYKRGDISTLALLLTSESINQVLVRSYYLRKYDAFRKQQVEDIETTREQLNASLEDYQEAKESSQGLLAQLEAEKVQLRSKETRLQKQVELLRRDRALLENQIREFRNEQSELNTLLTDLSRQEDDLRKAEEERQKMLALARQIGNERNRIPSEASSGPAVAVAEERAVTARSADAPALDLSNFSSSFRSAKGSLPWPVEKGVITTKFGVQVHPVFNTRVQNLGVDISAVAGSAVRVVNDGVVYAIQPMQGYGDVVFVNHGDYKTAYGNLSSVLVSRNQVIRRGDLIGLSGTQESVRGEVVFFLVRDGTQNVNPVGWLSPSAK